MDIFSKESLFDTGGCSISILPCASVHINLLEYKIRSAHGSDVGADCVKLSTPK